MNLLCVEPFGEIPDLVNRGAKFVELDQVREEACFGRGTS